MATKAILIAGLQKSGTTPLHRLLQQLPGVINPVVGEGGSFWGDSPAFSPSLAPCGTHYVAGRGVHGHSLSAEDFSDNDACALAAGARDFPAADYWVLKNPYNSVRLRWVRKAFPSARIVACVRQPAANVFSLLKKFVAHEGRGLAPEEGWWGVKPDRWRELLRADTVEQLALQWRAVNEALLSAQEEIDCWVDYAQFCANPQTTVAAIFEGRPPSLARVPETLRSSDNEYLEGGPALSRNRPEANSDRWLGPLSIQQRALIEQITASTWSALADACK